MIFLAPFGDHTAAHPLISLEHSQWLLGKFSKNKMQKTKQKHTFSSSPVRGQYATSHVPDRTQL